MQFSYPWWPETLRGVHSLHIHNVNTECRAQVACIHGFSSAKVDFKVVTVHIT